MLEYKVIELSTVTDEEIEKVVNEWIRLGWNLEGVQFAMREASKRPSMGFVFFTRTADKANSSEQIPDNVERIGEQMKAGSEGKK